MKRRSSFPSHTCSVVGCRNSYANTDKSVKFYCFPGRPHEAQLRELWINILRRNCAGTRQNWEPKKHSRICSQHFIGNMKSNHPLNPAYVPTIFPNVQKQKHKTGARNNISGSIPIKDEIKVNRPSLEFVAVEGGIANTSEKSTSTIKRNTLDTCMVIDRPSCSQVKSGIKRKIAASSLEETVKKLRTVVDDSIPDDEFDRFCKSLACQLREMPLERALICQEKLQSVMTEERLYQIGTNRYEQQSKADEYEIVVKEEDLGTEFI